MSFMWIVKTWELPMTHLKDSVSFMPVLQVPVGRIFMIHDGCGTTAICLPGIGILVNNRAYCWKKWACKLYPDLLRPYPCAATYGDNVKCRPRHCNWRWPEVIGGRACSNLARLSR